jgi:TetR/AcrR family transcriptional regulator, ethionamide resistance regulator
MASAQPSTAKRAQVQAAVLRTTEDLLAAGNSYADLKIERIATGAGISRTAFYFYFRDKRELLMRLTEHVAEILYTEADAFFSHEGDRTQEIRAALSSIAAVYRDHGALLRAIVEVSTYDEEIAKVWRALLQRFADATTRRVQREREQGEATDIDIAATAFALVWMTERTCYQQLVQGRQDPEELIDAMTGIWVRSLYGTAPDA